MVPKRHPKSSGFGSKIVFGHNLHHMAPFAIPRAGFCMVFQRASFVFSCPGPDLGAQDRILEPQVDILAWGPFWLNFWVPKNILLRGSYFVVGIQGSPFCPNDFCGPWDPFGCTSLSPNLLISLFCRDSQFSLKIAGGPSHLPVSPLFPFNRPLAM